MDERELRAIREFQECGFSRGWIKRIMERHDLMIRRTQSDRKLNVDQYIFARIQFLQTEREFWRRIGIILKIPQYYNAIGAFHEEIWKENEIEKIDASRVFNVDEVPFDCGITCGNVSAYGERTNLNCCLLSEVTKYRKGTIVLVMNYGVVLFAILIFKVLSGGQNVLEELRGCSGHLGTNVLFAVTKKGSMTHEVWSLLLQTLMNMTKRLRGCKNIDGTDWKKSIVLTADNYVVHLNQELANRFASMYGIFIRCLIKNASHLQQPVDQHIGNLIKRWLVSDIELLVMTLERAINLGITEKIVKSTWRELMIGFLSKALFKINQQEYTKVILSAWINFGLYLPLDGSLDGDPSTIHIDHKRSKQFKDLGNEYLEECRKSVTIEKRAKNCFQYHRINDTQSVADIAFNYNLLETEQNGQSASTEWSIDVQMLQYDLFERYKQKVEKYQLVMRQDFTHRRSQVPSLNTVITAQELLSLKCIFVLFPGRYSIEWLFTKRIGVPLRDEYGRILVDADQTNEQWVNEALTDVEDIDVDYVRSFVPMFAPRIDPLAMCRCNYHRTELVTTILTELELNGLIENAPTYNFLCTAEEIQTIRIEELLQEARRWGWLQQMHHDDKVSALGSWSQVDSNVLPSRSYKLGYTWAKNHGGFVGISRSEYDDWHEVWIEYIEQTVGFNEFELSAIDRITGIGIWEFLKEQLDNNEDDNTIVLCNSNNRSWFLAWLYLWAAHEELLNKLQLNCDENMGDNLLSKLLESLCVTTRKHMRGCLSMLVQYVEAFLIGHHCFWEVEHDLSVGMDILVRLSDAFAQHTMVHFDMWSECWECSEKYAYEAIISDLLYFNYPVQWNEANGIFHQRTDNTWVCSQRTCAGCNNIRYYKVRISDDKYFGIYFKRLIPENLWIGIKDAVGVKIGDHLRSVSTAIFLDARNNYICAYLIRSPNGEVKWYGWDTATQSIISDETVLSREKCIVLVFEAPKKCNVCDRRCMDIGTTVACGQCASWVHQTCLRNGRCNSDKCRGLRNWDVI